MLGKRTSHERLEVRLDLKSHNNNIKHDCTKCKEAKEKKIVDEELDETAYESEETVTDKFKPILKYCQCPQFKVTDKLLAFMADGQPNKRFIANE